MSMVPKLRFPEFEDELTDIKLGDIGPVSMCKRILKEQTTPDGDIPFYKIGTFGRAPDAFIDREIFEEYSRRYSYPKQGDVLISAAGTIGRLVVFDGVPSYFQDSNIVWIANAERLIKNSYLFYFLQTVKWTTEDTTIARLYNDNLRGIEATVPSLPEQQKIASFLSAVDKKIDLLRQKKEKLEAYKKGLMQKIFSQEIRFKADDGSDFPDWEEVALGDVGEFSSAGVDKLIVEGEPEVRLLNFLNVYNQIQIFDADLNQIVTAPERKIEQCNVRRGDVFFTPSSETREDIAYSAVAAEDMQGVVYSYHVVRLRLNKGWDYNFTCFAFSNEDFRNQCYRAADGSGQRYVISLGKFREMRLKVPFFDEQRKIGQILMEISLRLEQLGSTLRLLETFKKGLLQQMFV